jgi:pyruvate formate lyase activating enzyme
MICDPGGANQAPGDDSSAILSVNMTEADQNTGTIPEDVSGFPGRYWHALEDGRIQCDLCPRLCKLNEGQRGLCFVRARTDDQIVLTTYGRSSGYCIDPIEKKPLNHFLPGTPVLSFGTAGCNLTCKFCQNWDISKSREWDTLADQAMPEAIAKAAAAHGCRSVAFTYNDPVIFLEYAVDVAAACREVGVRTVAVTAGYISPEPRKEFFRAMDAANVDLKGFTERFYRELSSASLANVLDTLVHVKHETDCWLEITNLIIPGENDDPRELAEMSRWIARELGPDVPVHFSAFHPDWKMLDTPATPHETIVTARQIAHDAGLNYVYLGNVHDKGRQSTYCPNCATRTIGRDWYELSEWQVTPVGNTGGGCPNCGTRIPGVFDAQPGNWGRKRQPVKLGSG